MTIPNTFFRRITMHLAINLIATLGFSPSAIAKSKTFTKAEIEILAQDLAKAQGWKVKDLKQIFSRPQMPRLHDTVKLNITNPIQLSMRKYEHFSEPFALKLAERFSRKWITTFKKAAKRYQVDPEVISAIMLVETSYGRFKGDYPLLSVFASTYLDAKALEKDTEGTSNTQTASERITRKKKWALNELASLIKIKRRFKKLDVYDLRGSYAGAFGICQFLPSSYLNHAITANGSGTPNLFWEPDAIYSIANYLKNYGYQKPAGVEASRKAIFGYNNSDVYVDTVLGVAKRIAHIFK